MDYRFAKVYRGNDVGAPVPKDYTAGVIDALLQRGIIEVVKAILEPPKNKMVKRKAVAK
jgi:hypothetical protein